MIADEDMPGGLPVVRRWVGEVFRENPGRELWTLLDDPLRLALAQGWVLHTHREDDDLAEDLAAEDTDNRHFNAMLSAFYHRWRNVYEALEHGMGVLKWVEAVGVDMELVVLTGPGYVGHLPEGVAIPAHCFITRFEADDWIIAATARRLPVPGWPPTEEAVAGLMVDIR